MGGALKEIFHPKMLVVYLVFAIIGGLIGAMFGNPGLGAAIGAAMPLVFIIGAVFAAMVFIDGIISLFNGGRR